MKGLLLSTSSFSSFSHTSSPRFSSSRIHLRSMLVLASSTTTNRGSLISAWFRWKNKRLCHRHWSKLLSPDGRFHDGGAKFIKKVRRGGVEPSIRPQVWPFLLGVYDMNSSHIERSTTRIHKRKQYENLRKRCQQLLDQSHKGDKLHVIDEVSNLVSSCFHEGSKILDYEEGASKRSSCWNVEHLRNLHGDQSLNDGYYPNLCNSEEEDNSGTTCVHKYAWWAESSTSGSSREDENEFLVPSSVPGRCMEHDPTFTKIPSFRGDLSEYNRTSEDFATWQRIIRLDAIRANPEWVIYFPKLASVSRDEAMNSATSVGLKDYEHLDPCIIYHAARMVAVLEAYAVYDPEIGYCQGMSDLLSPILAVMQEDYEAFWCFAGLMRKARQNFMTDEIGIQRQLNTISKIIKFKDLHLYRHLEKLQAEDCFFVYRMVLVLFRRELTFEQTMCLWEVMWADQAAARSGMRKSIWSRVRKRPPPTDDLLLYAIAACILQRKKLIIERYSSTDEIVKECNNMAGTLDVWRLLDDAHDLVLTLHQKM